MLGLKIRPGDKRGDTAVASLPSAQEAAQLVQHLQGFVVSACLGEGTSACSTLPRSGV